MNVPHLLSDRSLNPFDWGSIGLAIASLFNWLPQVAALLTVIWFGLRIVIGWQEFRLNRRKLKE